MTLLRSTTEPSFSNPAVEEPAGQAIQRSVVPYQNFKRCLDLSLILIAGPAVLLVIVVAALAIGMLEGRPIFFIQPRVGLNGRIFNMMKLRTMTAQRQQNLSLTATLRNDPRITRLGRFLRKTHIDELPQLWNILKGDMTLIGPRPEQPHLVELYQKDLPDYHLRHTVKPGLTGLSQVKYGYAADLEDTRVKLQFDLLYIERYGLWLDVSIIILTCFVYLNTKFVR